MLKVKNQYDTKLC